MSDGNSMQSYLMVAGAAIAVALGSKFFFDAFTSIPDYPSHHYLSSSCAQSSLFGNNSKCSKSKRKASGHTIEIMVTDIESATNAIKGGANSLELCVNRLEGGVTPSIGFIEEVVNLCRGLAIEVNVLIRPRPGDFLYSATEFELIQRDILAAKNAGADGIVVGILTQEGHVDLTRMSVIRELTRGMSLTFHRAFDLCIDYKKAIEDVATVGCDRLLTSGQEKYAHLAAATRLKEIVNLVANRYLVVAGSGINADNVRMVISNSRVSAVHIASGANQTVLTNLSIDPILETPLFAMAAEMKVWKCVNESLVNTLAEKAWEAWIEIEHQKDKPQSQQQQH